MSIDLRRIKNVGARETYYNGLIYYAVDIHDNMAIYTEEDGWKYINRYRIEGDVKNVKSN